MALYDIIDEITERQVTKTETGDERMNGVTIGFVSKNYNKDMPGRVCVTIPTRNSKANELQWARLSMPSGGREWGHYFLPEPGDQVLLAFEGGDIEKPYVIGCVQKDNNKFLTGSVDEKNRTKRIVTKHGSMITFDDSPDDKEGKKDKITIQTAGKGHTILLDNENNKIRIADKAGEDYMEMKTDEGSGTLMLKIKSKITIQVGDTIKINLNGESGAVKIEASSATIEAKDQIGLKTDSMLKLEGGTVSQSASSAFKVDSSGAVKIGGTPISIG